MIKQQNNLIKLGAEYHFCWFSTEQYFLREGEAGGPGGVDYWKWSSFFTIGIYTAVYTTDCKSTVEAVKCQSWKVVNWQDFGQRNTNVTAEKFIFTGAEPLIEVAISTSPLNFLV